MRIPSYGPRCWGGDVASERVWSSSHPNPPPTSWWLPALGLYIIYTESPRRLKWACFSHLHCLPGHWGFVLCDHGVLSGIIQEYNLKLGTKAKGGQLVTPMSYWNIIEEACTRTITSSRGNRFIWLTIYSVGMYVCSVWKYVLTCRFGAGKDATPLPVVL